MKKYIALLMVFALVISLCGCGGSNGDVTDAGNDVSSEAPLTTVDISNYATIGRFPELNVGIGGIMGDVRVQYAGNPSLSYSSVTGIHILSCDSTTYYMTVGDYKVVAVMTNKEVFGLKNTTTPDKLAAFLGEPVTADVPNITKIDPYGNVSGDKWSQTYTMGENTLVFYYLSGKLYGTLLYKTGAFALVGE